MRRLFFILLALSLFALACDKNQATDESATAETTTDDGETADEAAGETAGDDGQSDDGAAATDDAKADEAADGQNPDAEDAPYKQLEGEPKDATALAPPAEPEQAPDTYRVKFDTTAGEFTIKVDRSLAPNGADRLYNLVKAGYYDHAAFFRVIDGFMAQFGIHGVPAVNKIWREQRITDDPVKSSNKRGMVTFATAGKDTRTTQLFINYGDNVRLDGMGFAPIGEVEGEGMKVVDALYSGYGEGAPNGRGPSQGMMQAQGNTYLQEKFPKLDYIESATIVEDDK